MRILITGGGGFVGSHVAEAELNNGNHVVSIDIAPSSKVSHLLKHKNFTYVQEGILNRELIESLIKNCDIIYHFAAIANVQTYVKNPLQVMNLNIDGLRLILEIALKHDKKVVFSSTSEIYGKNLKVPWSEDDDRVLGPTSKHRWCYSSSKAVGEHICFAYKELGLRMSICRFFNFYGPRLDFLGKGRVISAFLGQFLNNEPVTVVEPGDQTRSFTYITDGVDGILKTAHLKQAEGLVFNIGTDEEISILELAKTIKRLGKFSSEIIMLPAHKVYGEGYEDIFRRVPDITRAKTLLGWKPKVQLEEGLKITIDYYKNQNVT